MRTAGPAEQRTSPRGRGDSEHYQSYRRNLRAASRPAGVSLTNLRHDLTGPIQTALAVLSGAVLFILLICCANIAGMLSARAATRSSELAIRTLLGAGRSRVVRQLLTEAVLLFITGGAVVIAAGYGGLLFLLRLAPPELPQLQDTKLHLTVASMALVASTAAGLLFGLLPAL